MLLLMCITEKEETKMSILDGHVVLDGERRNNNNINHNNNGGNNKKRNNQNRQNRRFDSGELGFSKSSYLPEGEYNDLSEESNEPRNDQRAETIFEFCELFTSNVDNYRSLQDIMIDKFPDAIEFIKSYYSPKNNPMFQDALNKLIKLMCTSQFADTLMSVLESKEWEEDGTYIKIWDSIGFGLSLALETNHERMHSGVIKKYAFKIIPRMYKSEINDLCIKTGVTKDLANDLIIAIPIPSTDWNGANLDAFYIRFLDKMLIHAEDNADILNWEVQGMLYDSVFGKSKTALKVIGKYLASSYKVDSESEVVIAVFEEFKKMIYSKLDNYDISDIEYVISFVARNRAENPDKKTIFDSISASAYDNVRKALLSVVNSNDEYKKSLA